MARRSQGSGDTWCDLVDNGAVDVIDLNGEGDVSAFSCGLIALRRHR
jgi:hypothetical protein